MSQPDPRADRFLEKVKQGISLQKIGDEEEPPIARQRVSQILQKHPEYTKLSVGRKATGRQLFQQFVVSDRLRAAWNHLKTMEVSIQDGVEYLVNHPEAHKPENVGAKELPVVIGVTGLRKLEKKRLEKLEQQMGVKGTSIVIRNAIEVLIDRYKLKQFAKPPDWQAPPLTVSQSVYGVNPMPKLARPTKQKFIGIPMPLMQQINAKIPKGKLAEVARQSIDQADLKTLTPVPNQDQKLRWTTVNIHADQHELLEQWAKTLPAFEGLNDADVLVAILNQAISEIA